MQTIGERLEEARKRKGISIREAAEATKIRGDYLQKFESNQFDLGLADLYVRGFLRSYSLFLKLPADKLLADYNALTAGNAPSRRTPSREVYGRMDLSVASADDDLKNAPAQAAAAPEAESTPGRRAPSSFTRGGGSIPQGPMIDVNLIAKIAIAILVIVVVGLVVWGVKSMFSSGASGTPAPQQAVTPVAPKKNQLTISARGGPIYVQVETTKTTNGQLEAADIIYRGNLSPGESHLVDFPTTLWITSTVPSHTLLSVNGGTGFFLDPGFSDRQTRQLEPPR